MNPDWLNYEYMCMREHENLFNEIAFHWTRIPEYMLFQAGFIHDFNKLRMKRKDVFFEKSKREYFFSSLSGPCIAVYNDYQMFPTASSA